MTTWLRSLDSFLTAAAAAATVSAANSSHKQPAFRLNRRQLMIRSLEQAELNWSADDKPEVAGQQRQV